LPALAASAMNALAHAIEALYTPMANPVSELAGLRATALIAIGLRSKEPGREDLALGGLLAGYASGVSGFALHHVVCQTLVRVAVGPRIRALREGMSLSLRDLAQRSGVSAPMLSQVERGETSPTLAVAGRIASGLELSLSQLLRLDEGDGVTVVRANQRLLGG